MYHIETPKIVTINEDPLIAEILKERQQIHKRLNNLQQQKSILQAEITAIKKSLRRNALLLKLRKKTLREGR